MTRILTNPIDLAAVAAVGVLLLVVLARLVRVARRASRARIVTVGLLIPAAMALSLSASTSYRYVGGHLGITDLAERLTLCATVEAAIIALTLHAWGAKSKASAWLAYSFIGVQAIAAFEVSGGAGGVFRIAAGPLLLALMLHRLLGLELKLSGEQSTGLLASLGREIRERLTAVLGIGRRGADSAAISRSRAADRAVRLASRRRLGRVAAARLSKAIDAAQHGLDEADAAAAEASIVRRVARRKSVTDLHGLALRHVWSTSTASAPVSIVEMFEPALEEIAEPDTTMDTQGPAEPVISGWSGPRVSGRRRPRRAPRNLRPARVQQAPQMPAQQPEAAPAPQAPSVVQAPAQEPKKRVNSKVVVPAMRAAYPAMTTDAIADNVGVAERTVRRYLPAKDDRVASANGSTPTPERTLS